MTGVDGTSTRKHRGACLDMKEGPGKRDILSRAASKKAASRPRSAPLNEPKLVLVPLPEGVRHQRVGETTERSTPAHLKKLKQRFEAAPISRYLGMTLGYCENGVARVRLPFRAEFEDGHGVIHGGLIGLLADTAGNFAVGSVSPVSTVKTVGVQAELAGGSPGETCSPLENSYVRDVRWPPAVSRSSRAAAVWWRSGLPLTPSRPFSYLHPFVAAQPWIGYLYKTK